MKTQNRSTQQQKFYLMRKMPQGLNKSYALFKLSVDQLSGFSNLKSRFRQKIGYDLNLSNPISYCEKLIWKKVYDRNPLLTVSADKYRVRDYIRSILGEKEAEEILIPLLHVTTDPDNIPFDKLPESFVVKPNHGSNMHIIVDGNKDELKENIIKSSHDWLKVHYGFYNYEWAYMDIKRNIIIEKLLKDEQNKLPVDYKFYCFHGKCEVIRASVNRFGNNENSNYYDTEWNLLNVRRPGYNFHNVTISKPPYLEKMLSLSEKLSRDFDAVRVDLYSFNDKIYFGELTHYPNSGLTPFDPRSFDFELGKRWQITPEYWLKENKAPGIAPVNQTAISSYSFEKQKNHMHH